MADPEELNASDSASADDVKAVEELGKAWDKIRTELGKAVLGQQDVIEQLLIGMLAGGHCLLVGVPGLAKTLMVRSLASTLDLTFNRVQFTPDLMPADITGTEVIQENKTTGDREFRFIPGPIFSNVILADEINRTPPKTQAALLEAMQERQVTVGGQRHELQAPFFVLATQNPIEQEGTYPLPEAQLDRFMFEIRVDYPDEEIEFEIIRQTTSEFNPQIENVLTTEQILSLQKTVRRIPAADHVIRYAMQFARLSRPNRDESPDYINEFVSWGAGPRASQNLILGARARAMLQGRTLVTKDDVCAVAKPVLRHRIVTNFNAEAENITADEIVDRLANTIDQAQSKGLSGGRLAQILKT